MNRTLATGGVAAGLLLISLAGADAAHAAPASPVAAAVSVAGDPCADRGQSDDSPTGNGGGAESGSGSEGEESEGQGSEEQEDGNADGPEETTTTTPAPTSSSTPPKTSTTTTEPPASTQSLPGSTGGTMGFSRAKDDDDCVTETDEDGDGVPEKADGVDNDGDGKVDENAQVTVVPEGGAPTGDGSTEGGTGWWIGGGLLAALATAGVAFRGRLARLASPSGR